jgi:hypothetical protein
VLLYSNFLSFSIVVVLFFSYSYDLTHPLQYNMTTGLPVQGPIPPPDSSSKQKLIFWEKRVEEDMKSSAGGAKGDAGEEICFSDFSTKSGSFNAASAYSLTDGKGASGICVFLFVCAFCVSVILSRKAKGSVLCGNCRSDAVGLSRNNSSCYALGEFFKIKFYLCKIL